MKRFIVSVLLSLVVRGACFAQNSSNQGKTEFEKAFMLKQEGKHAEAFQHLKAAADLGIKIAQFEVAICYAEGNTVNVDMQEAFNYMYKAATGQAPIEFAWFYLGLYYFNGVGCSRNYKEAMKWWKKGTESTSIGDMQRECMFNVAEMYSGEFEIKRDEEQAMFWYKKAAEQGHPSAASSLGWGYFQGRGVERNEVEAVKWWRIAANLGHAKAQYNMGIAYLTGDGNTPINKSIALDWFKKAAAQGHTKALMKIAELEEE